MSIRITSTIPGFRRAGMAHPAKATTYPEGRFTEEQLSQLQNEPRLFVERLQDDQTSETSAEKGAVADERLAELLGYIRGMDREDASLWRQDNSPKADAYPVKTTAEERDAAWDAFVDSLESAAE